MSSIFIHLKEHPIKIADSNKDLNLPQNHILINVYN